MFGGTNGFVGIGVGVPHSGGGSNTDHESSVAIVCVFPKGTLSSSSIHADGSGNDNVGVGEGPAERKIEDKMLNGRTELYNSSSSTAIPSITNDVEDYSGDTIPVPSSSITQADRDGLKSERIRKEIVIEVVGGRQEEIEKKIEKKKDKEKEKEREIEIEIEVETRKDKDKEKNEDDETPVESSMAVLRSRGHGYNSNITCLATHSLELGR